MADDVVIRAEGLGKKYTIGRQVERERYTALRDVLARGARSAWRRTADMARGRGLLAGDNVEEFWALKDVSFEVMRGDVLGIIGRNGAGKSTLLKILSRITEPSEGQVTIKGRVASLLEVGTGFHPELTGRENIYLNGAILGMSRAEIKRKFDEIVAFAEVEKFLDTPVKRYSSGMYVRLAFAVAAHLEPEILVVDEVLAVGDAEFQKKCLGKMSEAATGGRTVLFVSHNMTAIEALCGRAIHLAFGAIIADAPTHEVTEAYLNQRLMSGNGPAAIVEAGLTIEMVHLPTSIRSGESAEIRISFVASTIGQIRECAVLFYSARGVRVAIVDVRNTELLPLDYAKVRFDLIMEISAIPLVEGDYSLGLYLVTENFDGNIFGLQDFSVMPKKGARPFAAYPAAHRGIIELDASSTIVFEDSRVSAL